MLKIEAMSEKDYLALGGQITNGNLMNDAASSSRGLNSEVIFGNDSGMLDDFSRTCTRSNVRGMIKLERPVVNYSLGGPSGDVLRSILGQSQTDFRKVIEFKLVWDIAEDRLESASNVSEYGIEEVLCHGDLVKKWIDEFDINQGIKEEIVKIFDKKLGIYITKDEVSYGSGDIRVIGNWYVSSEYINKELATKCEDSLSKKLVVSGNERIVYLVNMKDKSALYGMLYNYIAVTPPDLRPAIGNMYDQFTKKYSEVLKRNEHLELVIASGHQVKEFIFVYASLVRSVTELTYKPNEKDKNSLSVQKKLSGKTGFIRDKMLGKRTDYSGRSTIIVNPSLSLDQCGIPEDMLPKLYRHHLMKAEVFANIDKLKAMPVKEVADRLEKAGILNRIPVTINRAPTLHRLSFLGFKAVRAKSKAIEFNPLVCGGYNADFDGDSVAAKIPISDEAIAEVNELMLSTRNLFTPASGKPTLVPRQEIIYGLNVASKDYENKSTKAITNFNSLDELKGAVLMHKIKVWDKANVEGIGVDTAGRHIIRCCLPKDLYNNVKEITKKSIEDYIDWILPFGITQYKKSIDSMVDIGFKLAKLYAPTCNILVDIKDDFLKNPFAQFHKNMEKTIELHDLGFEDEVSFQMKFNEEFQKVEDTMKERIANALGEDNGYLKLVNSGARGSIDNLIQIYGYKGRIAKSSYESFNAIIENSFTSQLSPLEHFISAYGTRKGMIDKVQKTGDTGYAMRLMYQASSDVVIKSDDCGTTNSLRIRKADIMHYIKSEDELKKNVEVNKIFRGIIEGRYVAKSDRMFSEENYDSDNNKLESLSGKEAEDFTKKIRVQRGIAKELKDNDYYVTGKLAEKITLNFKSLAIRSPLTCNDQCCSRCYGEDLTIRGKAVKGLAIGFIAGQSIGEPGTQLTMRTFHKGGVAGKADVTSDFDRIESFIKCSDISDKPTYDPIAWADGKIIKTETPTELKIKIEGSKVKSKAIPKTASIKDYAVKGEGLCKVEGDHNISEILEYAGLESAQKYLLYSMHTTYIGKADINIKHFEVLVSAMTLHLVLNTDREDLRPGLFYSLDKLLDGSLENTRTNAMIKSVKVLQTLKNDPLSTMLMENFGYGLSRSLVLGLESNYETQMGRLMLGLSPKVGTGLNPNYIEERKREEVYYGND